MSLETISEKTSHTESMTLNMGPQHPSTHGVLRLVLELDGETVLTCDPVIGYLHTGIEKSCEDKPYYKVVPLTDRIDYLAPQLNNLAYCLAAEKLIELEIPAKAQCLRVLIGEMARIGSHLVWLGTHAMDMGATTVFMYAFREREKVLAINEMVSGVRMMTSFFRIGGLMADVPPGFDRAVRDFITTMQFRIDEYETLLTKNEIWLDRTKGVGVISIEDAVDLGLSGPSLRATGLAWDIRKAFPYSGYEHYEFDIPTGKNSDVFDRYMVRIQEMRQSVRIMQQCIDSVPEGPWRANKPPFTPVDKDTLHTSMEALIYHFKYFSEGFSAPAGVVYQEIEGSKGEYGVTLASDGGTRPIRVHFRTPSFVNLQSLAKMVEGRLVADVVACIGSIDIVLGEVDR